MTIRVKDLKTKFHTCTFDRGKTIILSDPIEMGTYNVRKYVGHVTKVAEGKYMAHGCEPTRNLEKLIEGVENRYKSFKYNSEFYNPHYRKGYFCEMCVIDWLNEKGFKHENSYMEYSTYVLERSNVYGLQRGYFAITFTDLDTMHYEFNHNRELPTDIKISLSTSKEWSWVSVRNVTRDPDAIIDALQGLLKPLLLHDAASDLKLSNTLQAKDINPILEQIKGMEIKKSPFKDELIAKLEETLQTLKSA